MFKRRCQTCEEQDVINRAFTGMLPFSFLSGDRHWGHFYSVRGSIEDDWYRVGRDIYSASERYKRQGPWWERKQPRPVSMIVPSALLGADFRTNFGIPNEINAVWLP